MKIVWVNSTRGKRRKFTVRSSDDYMVIKERYTFSEGVIYVSMYIFIKDGIQDRKTA